MSDRYIRLRYRTPSPEPFIIERVPRRYLRSYSPPRRRLSTRPRRVSFGVATDPSSKRTVVFKESTYHRQRRSGRRSRTPSPSPPISPHRGRDHIMSERLDGEYVPLPKKLPKDDERSGSSGDDSERRRRRKGKEKVRVVHHLDDPEIYPVVETPSTASSGRRDSGVFSGGASPRDAKYFDKKGRPITLPERRPIEDDSAVQDLARQFNDIITNERLEKLDAEAKANRLQEKLNKAQAEIDQNKRASWLDDRERRVVDREKRLSQTSSRESPSRREVVINQPSPPARRSPDNANAATDVLNKARADYQRKKDRDSKDYGRKY